MEIAIVKYNAGNMFSVVNALKRLGITPQITDEAEQLQKADRVLFPGQGNAKRPWTICDSMGWTKSSQD